MMWLRWTGRVALGEGSAERKTPHNPPSAKEGEDSAARRVWSGVTAKPVKIGYNPVSQW